MLVTVLVILLFSKFTKYCHIQMMYCRFQVVTGLLRKCGEVSRQIVTGGDSKDFEQDFHQRNTLDGSGQESTLCVESPTFSILNVSHPNEILVYSVLEQIDTTMVCHQYSSTHYFMCNLPK